MLQTVLKPHNLDAAVKKPDVLSPLHMEDEVHVDADDNHAENADHAENTHDADDMTQEQLLDGGYEKDAIPNRVLELLANGSNCSKDLSIADCTVVNGRLHY